MSNVLVAGFYRSGSNHIAGSLARAIGSHRTFLHEPGEGYAQDPQRLSLHVGNVLLARMNGMVYLSHITGSTYNIRLLREFKLHTIVTMRKLYPCLHSLRRYEDDMVKWGRKDAKYFNADWKDYTNEQKWKWVAYHTIPWYYASYTSWMRAKEKMPIHIVRYEEHFSDQLSSAKEMIRFIGAPMPTDDGLFKAFIHNKENYTANRTVYEMPSFVEDIARDQASCWGPVWSKRIEEDLL